MNHKRRRAPNRRAGCGMCKPHKLSHFKQDQLGHRGFGKLRRVIHTGQDLREALKYV